jgi:Na+-transporting methylmalonyl-CoA/oxaloacetate decarboxylase beta subunit
MDISLGAALVVVALLALMIVALAVGLVAARRMTRPRPALPVNCGDCVFMIPRAKVYRRETLEDEDGIVHYLCQQRWIEVTPYSPWCELGKSKTRTTVAAR